MPDYDPNSLEDLYSLIDDICTTDEIIEVMRPYKDLLHKKLLKISGKDKAEVVANLREAFYHGIIPPEDTFNLLRHAEENGRQYIFLWKAKTEAAKNVLLNGYQVAKTVLGNDWQSKYHFPYFVKLPDKVVVVDFRIEVDEKKKSTGWVLKYYDQKLVKTLIDEKREGNLLKKTWEEKPTRTVLMMKMNPSGILEVRVPNWGSISDTQSMHREVWRLVQGSRMRDLVYEYPVGQCLTNITRARAINTEIYHLGMTRLCDEDGGTSTFAPSHDEDNISKNEARSEAMDTLLNAGEVCDHLGVTWLPQSSGGALSSSLLTKFGINSDHDLGIGSRTTAVAINYILGRLIEFEKGD